jgi:hypothetical protein
LTKFCWKDFVRDVQGGKTSWSHQELLELAWNLFHDKRLYYKRFKRSGKRKNELGDENLGEDDDLLVERLGEESEGESDDELMGEQDEEELRRLKSRKNKRRRRRRCKYGTFNNN